MPEDHLVSSPLIRISKPEVECLIKLNIPAVIARRWRHEVGGSYSAVSIVRHNSWPDMRQLVWTRWRVPDPPGKSSSLQRLSDATNSSRTFDSLEQPRAGQRARHMQDLRLRIGGCWLGDWYAWLDVSWGTDMASDTITSMATDMGADIHIDLEGWPSCWCRSISTSLLKGQ